MVAKMFRSIRIAVSVEVHYFSLCLHVFHRFCVKVDYHFTFFMCIDFMWQQINQ